MYTLIIDEESMKFLEKLDKNISKRISLKLIESKSNPHHFFKRLTGIDSYKLRVGDYRIISDIDDNSLTINIRFIGHRKNVYDKI